MSSDGNMGELISIYIVLCIDYNGWDVKPGQSTTGGFNALVSRSTIIVGLVTGSSIMGSTLLPGVIQPAACQ